MPRRQGEASRRGLVLLAGVGLWILVLLCRLVDLQVVRREEFVKRARRQQERTVELPPRRGAIADRYGRPLAVTAQVDSVFAIPGDVEDPEGTARTLAPILGVGARELSRKLSEPDKEFVWLARRVPEATARQVASRRIPGVRLLKEATRRYPQGTLAASVLGYAGADNQGLAGLEHRFDDEVRGRPARVTLLRDAAQRAVAAPGRWGRLRAEMGEEVEGAGLVLTLDAAIQHAAERELARGVAEYRAKGGSAVVLDPRTGEVLALASVPSFDPNRYAEADPEERRCRPVLDAYEPGSTFKVITAAIAVEAGLVGPDDPIDCGGGTLTIGRTTIHEHGENRWGVLPLTDVLAHSSNIGIAHVGLSLGKVAYHRGVRSFGFGQRTGIELHGETPGLLSDVSSWSALTLPTMSFGQEVGVTVLQMARAYAAIASGGLLPQPHLVAEVRRPDGRVLRRSSPAAARVLSERTAATVKQMMLHVVENGTGKLAAIPGFTVAGKTGTAQKAAPGGGYSRDRFVASFIGFVPAESPRVVIAVVVDEPKGRIYGGDVAAPVFSAIGAETLRILHEAAREEPGQALPNVLLADLAPRGVAPLLSSELVPASHRLSPAPAASASDPAPDAVLAREVPDVTGLSARDAVRLLSRRGLSARVSGHGFVVSQDPPGGTAAERGSSCSLVLSLERPVEAAALEPEPAETLR